MLPPYVLNLGLSTEFLICVYLLLAYICRQWVCTYQFFQSPIVVCIFCMIAFCLCLFPVFFFLYTLFHAYTFPVYVFFQLQASNGNLYLYFCYCTICIFDMAPFIVLTIVDEYFDTFPTCVYFQLRASNGNLYLYHFIVCFFDMVPLTLLTILCVYECYFFTLCIFHFYFK
jgi:hypothetical protein